RGRSSPGRGAGPDGSARLGQARSRFATRPVTALGTSRRAALSTCAGRAHAWHLPHADGQLTTLPALHRLLRDHFDLCFLPLPASSEPSRSSSAALGPLLAAAAAAGF